MQEVLRMNELKEVTMGKVNLRITLEMHAEGDRRAENG